jgi:hypothetical protein
VSLILPRVCKINNIIIDAITIENEFGVKMFSQELLHAGRYADFSGIFEDKFTLTARVIGDSRWEQIRNILSQEKIISLTLPTTYASTIEVLPASTVKCNIFDNSHIGMYTFTIDFEVSKIRIDIEKASNSANIQSSRFAFLSKLSSSVVNNYRLITTTVQNATDTMNSISSSLNNISQAIPSLLNEAQLFATSLVSFQNSIQSIINLPDQIDSQINSLVSTFVDIGATVDVQINAIKSFIDKNGIDDNKDDSSFAADVSNATIPLQESFYCHGLENMAFFMSNKEYTSKDEISIDIDYLITQKNYIKNKFRDKTLLDALNLYLNNIIIALKNKLIQIPANYEYKFDHISDYAAYYMYYGNLDDIQSWRNYNKIPNYGIVNQNIKYLWNGAV